MTVFGKSAITRATDECFRLLYMKIDKKKYKKYIEKYKKVYVKLKIRISIQH